MTEAQFFEKIGRLQVQAEERDQAYGALLDLLAKVVSGEIARSRVMVNLTDRSWTYSPPGTTPGMPARINGLPVVVIAPEEMDEPEETLELDPEEIELSLRNGHAE